MLKKVNCIVMNMGLVVLFVFVVLIFSIILVSVNDGGVVLVFV